VRIALIVAIVAALGVMTWRRCRVYQDTESLAKDTLRQDPNSPWAHSTLGVALFQQGNFEEALKEDREAARLAPDWPETQCNLGDALMELRQLPEAAACYEAALRLQPNAPMVRLNLGNVLLLQGRDGEAAEQYYQALEGAPDSARIHNNLATALLRSGRTEEALSHYETAADLEPRWPAPLIHLAWAQATDPEPRFRDAPSALRNAERACELAPDNAAALDVLAAAHAASGDFRARWTRPSGHARWPHPPDRTRWPSNQPPHRILPARHGLARHIAEMKRRKSFPIRRAPCAHAHFAATLASKFDSRLASHVRTPAACSGRPEVFFLSEVARTPQPGGACVRAADRSGDATAGAARHQSSAEFWVHHQSCSALDLLSREQRTSAFGARPHTHGFPATRQQKSAARCS